MPKIILVVDDDEVARTGLALILQREGYEAILASDTKEALRYLEGGGTADMILLDMIMPYHDGWQFFHQRSRHSQLASIPVLVMTGLGIASEEWALALGAVGLIRKPLDVTELMDQVRRHIDEPTLVAKHKLYAPDPGIKSPGGAARGGAAPGPAPGDSTRA
jgi:CheY-like chemotaxis protein